MDDAKRVWACCEKSRQKTSAGLSSRLYVPDEEKRTPRFSRLLDAYAVVDTGVATALRDAEKKDNRKPACSNGCDVCCRQKDIS